MKRLKLFENFSKQKKLKVNLKTKIELNKNGIIEGMYLVFINNEYNWRIKQSGDNLVLGRIINIDNLVEENGQYYRYADVLFIDFVTEIEQNFQKNEKRPFSIESSTDFKKILYSSVSLRDAKNKFDELVKQSPYSEWYFRTVVKNYNL